MKLNRLSFLLLVVAFLLVAPQVQGQMPGAMAPTTDSAIGAPLPTFATWLAASQAQDQSAKAKGGTVTPGAENQAFCTEYDIECTNGKTDECCGDVESCLSYCGRVCGGRCVEG